MTGARIIVGDCIERMREMGAESIDAIVCDPPYELGFMGKGWDSAGVSFEVATWQAAWRVLKPGGHLLAFGGTRTYHRIAVAIEDAGFEIRDCLSWLYGSGFPKSLDVSKAIDKQRKDNPDWQAVGAWLKAQRSARGTSAKALCAAIGAHGEVNHGGAVSNWENGFACPTWEQWLAMKAALSFGDEMDAEVWRLNGRKGQPGEAWHEREITGEYEEWQDRINYAMTSTDGLRRDVAATPEAAQWAGWGTALKPAHEPVIVARKPADIRYNLRSLVPTIEEQLCKVDTFAKTDTLLSELLQTSGYSNIASWLRKCLADLSSPESRYTTETATALITDLKTLRSYLSALTQSSTTQGATEPNGIASSVWFAVAISTSVVAKCERLVTTIAGESAIDPLADQATDRVANLSPNWEPVIVARKPIQGTVAANVMQHGTGALNIDGCRIGYDPNDSRLGWLEKYAGRDYDAVRNRVYGERNSQTGGTPEGRWPANVALDGWDEPVLRLRYNIPSEVDRLIREFYRDYRRVSPLSETHRDVSEPQGPHEVLLSGVLGGVAEREPARRESPDARQEALAGIARQDERAETGDGAARPGQSQLENGALPLAGLRDDCACGPTATRARAIRLDGDSEQQPGDTGTPACDGSATRAAALALGASASHQRNQIRQSAGESRSNGAQRSQERTHGDPGRVETITGPERIAIASPLCVLECDIPQGWLAYFEPTGRSVPSPDSAAAMLDAQSGVTRSTASERGAINIGQMAGLAGESGNRRGISTMRGHNDTGGASRFFYVAKASRRERNAGLEGMPEQHIRRMSGGEYAHNSGSTASSKNGAHSQNHHPTVKPISLMRWLCRLVCPPGGTVLDPFAGSGSTGCAAALEGFDFIGIEMDPEYAAIAEKRIAFWSAQRPTVLQPALPMEGAAD